MGLAAFNRFRRAQEKANLSAAEKHDQFVKECEAKGLDPQLMSMTQECLEDYAMNTFSVALDKRKSFENMVRDVMALEDANPEEDE